MENKKTYRYCKERKTIAEFDTVVNLYKYDTEDIEDCSGYRIRCEGIEFDKRDNGVSVHTFKDAKLLADLEYMEEIEEWYYEHALSYMKECMKIVSDVYIDYNFV